MFFSSPSADLKVIIVLLVIALVISAVAYIFSKKLLLSIAIFSILGNVVLYLNAGSEIFDIYKIKWLVKFTISIWPLFNIVLLLILIMYSFRKNAKFQKK